MVLAGKGRSVPAAEGRSRGLTLIELVVAIGLGGMVTAMALALFRDVASTYGLMQSRRQEALRAQALVGAMADNLLAGGGIVRLGPGRLVLVNPGGQRVDYQWQDSTLTVNGKTWPLSLASLELDAEGPDCLVRRGLHWERIADHALDTLDGDQDGRIEFRELDRDMSGDLDARECRFVARVRVTLTAVIRGAPVTLRATLHPRNHSPKSQDDEREGENAGIFPSF